MSSSTSETSQSESSSQEDKYYLEQSGSSEEKKRRKSKNKKKDKQKKKNKSKNKNKHSKKNKHKQKAYNKHKHKNKKKEEKKKKKNEQKKKKHSKNKKKITKLSQITGPVEKRIPKCQNCNKKQSQFYCTKCEVYYCAKCEEQAHNIYALKKHKKHLYKAPYNELVKKVNFNLCRKHNKELSLYCIDENKLICSECYSTCKLNDHEILGLQDFSNEIYEKIKIILNKIQNEENQNKETIQKSLENQNKLKEKIKNIYKNHIKLIQGGNEIIKPESKREKKERERKEEKEEKEKTEKERKCGKSEELEEKEKKSGKRKGKKSENRIKLKNENKTARNPYNDWGPGKICGKKIYSSGKHEIKIKIDQFPNPKNQWNQIKLGIIKTENRENFIKNHWNYWEETYFFKIYWDGNKLESRKWKNENGKWTVKNLPKKNNFKKKRHFHNFS
ncbi:motif protein trim9 [Anaeramoeba flamelloides]|uniref:Motif protein trim9 n=1 Tax=Anaeramoeba flamelloides TaxID=1746091 RepID=A0AAV7Y598_9EUKA|nr:motif protein trim9 [Anaeramoeba flamelloides]